MAIKAEYIWIDGTVPTPEIRSKTKILADGDSPLTLEVVVERLGQEDYAVRTLYADPLEPSVWGDPANYRSERDNDGNGHIDILDLATHFSLCR